MRYSSRRNNQKRKGAIRQAYPAAPQRLRCEFATNPLGVENLNPRLSWWVSDPRPAEIQSAYEICAASSLNALQEGNADLWRSGVVEGQQNTYVLYAGANLNPGQKVWWQVRTFDSDGVSSPWSEPAQFEVGILSSKYWPGHWMSSTLEGSRARAVPVTAFRRQFELVGGLVQARLYVAALGDVVVSVNGQQLPNVASAAIWSDYRQECYYQTFDVASLLKSGGNALGILLADGYFSGTIPQVGRGIYGNKPKVRCWLQLEYDDGEEISIASDHHWHWHPSWIVAAEINAGEHMDARQKIPGWDCYGEQAGWSTVVLDAADSEVNAIELRSQPYPAANVTRLLRPVETQHHASPSQSNTRDEIPQPQLPRSAVEYDFGSAIVGRARLELVAHQSDDIRVFYSLSGEFENSIGGASAPLSLDTYTTSPQTEHDPRGHSEVVEGCFALHSFRYVRVEYTLGHTEVRDAYALKIAYPQAPGLSFRSDHATLNELVDVLHNSLDGVAMSVPMRGVTYDERIPDLAYALTWVPRLAQEERAHALILKWLRDLKLAQINQYERGEGASNIVPPVAVNNSPSATQFVDEMACYETFLHTLWALYRHQDNVAVLRDCYAEIRVGALAFRHQTQSLLRHNPYAPLYGEGFEASLIATCTVYGVLKLAARIASILGQMGDHELIESQAHEVKKAFRNRFVTPSGHLAGDSQSIYVAALHHNMLEPSEREIAQQRLIELLVESNYHADVVPGVLRALLPTLTQAGRLDMAYMVLLQTSQPSWLGNIRAGDKLVARRPGKFDIAEIGLMEWLVTSMIGLSIDDDYSLDKNGYTCVRIQPRPPLGQQFLAGSPVELVEANLETPQGIFEIKWQIEKRQFSLQVVIPPGAQATVVMPDGIEHPVRSGHHEFVMAFDAPEDGVPLLVDVG